MAIFTWSSRRGRPPPPPASGAGTAGGRLDAAFFRPLWRGALIANKGYDLERANAVLGHGAADLVSFATLYLANPDLPERLRRGGPFNVPDRKTFYGGAAAGYTDYPALTGPSPLAGAG